MTRKRGTGLLLSCCLAMMATLIAPPYRAYGQEAPPEKPNEEKPVEESKQETPKEKSLLDRLGEELLKEIDDAPGGNPDQPKDKTDKMDRAVKGMRQAGEKLDEGVTAEETQKIQQQVIKDLEDIINQLQNPPPSQGGGGGGGGSSGGGGGGAGSNSSGSRRGGNGSSSSRRGGSPLRRSSQQQKGGEGMAKGNPQQIPGMPQDQDGESASENGMDSSKQSQGDRKAEEEAKRRQKLEMDIWGHLPPHVREELLNTYRERMLPKYEHMVKQFYEALSTQSDPKKK